MKRLLPLAIAVGSLALLGLSSCGKIKELSSKLTGATTPEAEKRKEAPKNLPGLSITQEQLDQSDAGVDAKLKAWEKLPRLLVKVQDEKTAFETRKKIDLLAVEMLAASKQMIEITNKEDLKQIIIQNKNNRSQSKGRKRVKEIDATVYWYVKVGNESAYEKRSLDVANSIIAHLDRIFRKTGDTPVVEDVIHSGILEMIMAEEGITKKDNSKNTIKPMPKNWLPSGVTRG